MFCFCRRRVFGIKTSVRQVLILVCVLASWDSSLAASIQAARYPILQMSMVKMVSQGRLLLVVDSYQTWFVTALPIVLLSHVF